MGDIRKARQEALDIKRKEVDFLASTEIERSRKAQEEGNKADARLAELISQEKHKKDNIAILDKEYSNLTKKIKDAEVALKDLKESNERELLRINTEKANLVKENETLSNKVKSEYETIEKAKEQASSIMSGANSLANAIRLRGIEIDKEKKALEGIRTKTEESIVLLRQQEEKAKEAREALLLTEKSIKEQREINNRELTAIQVSTIKNTERCVSLDNRENNLRVKEEQLSDREIAINLKQERLNKLEARVNLMIEAHNLKVQ